MLATGPPVPQGKGFAHPQPPDLTDSVRGGPAGPENERQVTPVSAGPCLAPAAISPVLAETFIKQQSRQGWDWRRDRPAKETVNAGCLDAPSLTDQSVGRGLEGEGGLLCGGGGAVLGPSLWRWEEEGCLRVDQ